MTMADRIWSLPSKNLCVLAAHGPCPLYDAIIRKIGYMAILHRIGVKTATNEFNIYRDLYFPFLEGAHLDLDQHIKQALKEAAHVDQSQ